MSDNVMKPLVGSPLDYSKKENWMFFSDLNETEKDVDVFFLYPTSVLIEVKTVVCEDIKYMRQNAHKSYIQAADTFSSFTNMYAPYYRQVSAVGIAQAPTAEGFMETVRNNVTRTDAYAALDYYFENCNKGKPYILAGHSQGSCTLKLVLSEYMKKHPEYLDRLVACYAIGFYFPDSWFKENPQIRPATGETDTGVLVTWNTEGPGATKYNLPIGNNDGFCINPLNWKTDETPADVSMNKGSLFLDNAMATSVFNFVAADDEQRKEMDLDLDLTADNETVAAAVRKIMTKTTEGAADATIDKKRGAIVTTTYKAFIPDNPVFGDKSCHFEDWSLYTINIRENAQKRIAAFLGREGK